MNIVLVSGRYAAPEARHAVDTAFATALAARGVTVRLLCPVPRAVPETGTPRAGIRRLDVVSPAPPFQAVQGRLLDPATERELSRALRSEMADLVHVLDYGGATSANLTWVADRLGAPTVVTMQALPVLCHRGDLLYAGAGECREWLDPARCAACVVACAPGGLSPAQSAIGWGLGLLRWPLNPYPTEVDFVNRPELLVGGAQFVDRIVVGSEADGERIRTLGLRAELFEALEPWTAGAAVEPWLDLYRRVLGR